MVRCWKHGENSAEEQSCAGGASAAASCSRFPRKAFWIILSASLLLLVIILGLTGHLWSSQTHSQSSQVLRIWVPDQTGVLVNQSVVVDRQNHLVTYSLTSAGDQTSTVVFDLKHGLICYKPVEQRSCFLRKMDASDYDNLKTLLQEQEQQQTHFLLSANQTQRQTQFLDVLTDSPVDASTLEKPLRVLCQDRSVHWTRKTDGAGKQRLVYFCIDVCFPSNICVSVCFYYLPE